MRELFGLAPMDGVSDFPFRLWFAQVSAPQRMSTPFLRATDSFPKSLPADFAPELNRLSLSYDLIPQVMASRPEDFVRAARLLLDAGAPFVDLNCGCPSPNPVSGGAGSSLLKTTLIFLDFIRAIARHLPERSFSVKMRTGFDDTSLFHSAIEGLAHLPLKQLTVHGRTRKDRYDGHARWDLIEHARGALPFPVVASGDIVSHASWLDKKSRHPAIEDAIIGRGALRNPWIFMELRSGAPVRITRRTLVLSLACFARIMDISYTAPETLDALLRDGLFARTCGSDEGAWQRLWERLGGSVIEETSVERFAFGRTKMIWNSLRSSLPSDYFEPTLLRAKTLGEFLSALMQRGPDEFHVQHDPSLDWLYTSSRKKDEPLSRGAV